MLYLQIQTHEIKLISGYNEILVDAQYIVRFQSLPTADIMKSQRLQRNAMEIYWLLYSVVFAVI